MKHIEFVCDESGEPSGKNYPYIIGCLMDGHCPGTSVRVILSEQGIVGRAEKRLSTAGRNTTRDHEHNDTVGNSCEHCRGAPEQNGEGYHPFAAETVPHPSSERYHKCVEQVEQRRYEAYGCVGEIQCLAYRRKHGVEYLAVSLVEQVSHPQQEQNLPFDPSCFFPCSVSFHQMWYFVLSSYNDGLNSSAKLQNFLKTPHYTTPKFSSIYIGNYLTSSMR